jgi:hypothetical protein
VEVSRIGGDRARKKAALVIRGEMGEMGPGCVDILRGIGIEDSEERGRRTGEGGKMVCCCRA